ncbi:MAG TPA: hypothetical protein VFW66_00495 [Gemmatimonadales bacterium]|nr:hypothetical protein [Gemmatimonadales bacterium]
MPAMALRPLSLGEIIDTSFQVYRRHFGTLAVVVLVCYGIPTLLQVFVNTSGGAREHPVLELGYLVLVTMLGAVATGATVFVVSEAYLGRTITAQEALARAAPYLWRLVLSAILFGLLLIIGFIFFIVPSIVFACGFALVWPALVLESLPSATAGLRRSWQLTRGAKWKVLGLWALLFLILLLPLLAVGIVIGVAGAIFAATGAQPAGAVVVASVVLTSLVQLAIYPLYYCALTIIYYDLRVRREGFDLELLASTLQVA